MITLMSLNLNVASSVINSMVDGHTIKRLDLLLRAGLSYGLELWCFMPLSTIFQ